MGGDTCADKAKAFAGKGRPVESRGQENPGGCSATWLTVSGFMVMGSVSGLSVVSRSDPESFQRWIPERKILGGWWDMWSVSPFSF